MARNNDILSFSNQSATFNSQDITPSGDYKGAIFYIDPTEDSGTATFDVQLQGKDSNGTYYNVAGAAFATISDGTAQVLTVYPGIAETANVSVSDVLPGTYRFTFTITGTGQYDFRLEAQYLT